MHSSPDLVDTHTDDFTRTFLRDVLEGLSGSPRSIPSKYFYDAMGSALFDRICALDEYYLTRAETALMERHAADMAEHVGPRARIVEFGSGNSRKTEILLDHLQEPVAYIPIDISVSYLEESVRRLSARYPDLEIHPVTADYTDTLSLPEARRPWQTTVVYFPGSTIGNFDRPEARAFLRRLRPLGQPQGGVLIGVDLIKDAAILERAYNDAAGVTAAFNLNLLARINRELAADFDVSKFRHRAHFDASQNRIEMRLISTADQTVQLGDRAFSFRKDDYIRTEYSYKYDVEGFARLAEEAGLRVAHTWIDDQALFSVHLLRP